MPIFVDTNVLVYARDSSQAEKQIQAQTWLAHLWKARTGRLSYQVLHEFYVTTTRKLRPGLPAEEARADVRDLLAWHPLALDGDVLERAWSVEDTNGLSFWDALIVSAARRLVCQYLLTEDLQHGHVVDGVQVVSPFRTSPTDLDR